MLTNRETRAAVAVILVLAAGCSVNQNGISVGSVDADENGGSGAGGAGTGGGGGGGGTIGRDGSIGIGTGDGSPDKAPTVDVPPGGPDSAVDRPAPPPPPPPPSDAGPDAPRLVNGTACTAGSACESGFCVDKVCCEKSCGEACFSCSMALTNMASGLCRPSISGIACGTAMCSGATFTPVPKCDGNGSCVMGTPATCPNTLTCANATVCHTKCGADGDCTGGRVCDVASGTCHAPGKSNGQACAAPTECSTGNCADGVCCDLPCTAVCRSCRMADTGKPDGTCANLPGGANDAGCPAQDPSTCGRDGTCEAGGRCHLYPATTGCGTECCRGDGGPGGGAARICSYQCNGTGACDRTHPMILDTCKGVTGCCCTPAAGGAPMCALAGSLCAGTCVQ
jgi:hypothetical protein